MRYLIKDATVLKENQQTTGVDLLIENGVLLDMGSKLSDPNATIVEGEDLWVFPGFCDIGAQAKDPGYEHREDIQSLQKTGAAGGYTQIVVFPNTNPVVQNKAEVHYIQNSQDWDAPCTLHSIGAISQKCAGTDIAEMLEMNHAGALAFSDGRKPVQIGGVMLRALLYVKTFDGLIINRPEDESLFHEPQMHEGITSTSLGMRGQSSLAEEIMLERDLSLLKYTDSKLMVYGVSSAKSVEMIRQAKKEGLHVTAATCIWNLIYTDEDLSTFDVNYKLKPMLRSARDRQALIDGVKDGTIDIIVSNHDAYDAEDKKLEFPYATFGALGLQTMFSVYESYLASQIDILTFVQAISSKPKAILNLEQARLEQGQQVDLCVFDRKASWDYNASTNTSKCDNSPVMHQTLQAKHILTLN